ncbi:MAG: hypothetical protein VZQ83_08730, partial [Eubacterium sp.]|nr:hypothetical protein [Eubacterium sp.]
MSNRRDSLKRLKRLNKATEDHDFIKTYTWEGDKQKDGGLPAIVYVLIAIGAAALLTTGILLWMHFGHTGEGTVVEEPQVEEDAEPTPTPPVYTTEDEPGPEPGEKIGSETMPTTATFLQGPKGWKKRIDWSGEWGDKEYDGRRFAGFGCGLCVMANFYTTLTPYACSPISMYKYAKRSSSYEGGGAIDWPQIKQTMESLGFTVETGRKPKKYKHFREKIASSMAAMVVVSSWDDNSYWKQTPGHYITILGYREEDDKIFLGDSGD